MNTNNALSFWNNGLGSWGDLRREVDRLFSDYWSNPSMSGLRTSETQWYPACEVDEAEDHYLLTVEMPGISKDQIRLEVVDSQIIISGERKQEARKNADSTWYSERKFGRFSRSFSLPVGVSSDKIEADYRDGILRVYIPKAESAKPRLVKITNGAGTGFFGKLLGQSSAKVNDERQASNDFKAERIA